MSVLRYAVLFFCVLSLNLAAQSDIYIKKSSFKETIFAARQALTAYEKSNSPLFYVTPEIDAAEPLKLKLDIRNKKKIFLRAVMEKGYDQYYDDPNQSHLMHHTHIQHSAIH